MSPIPRVPLEGPARSLNLWNTWPSESRRETSQRAHVCLSKGTSWMKTTSTWGLNSQVLSMPGFSKHVKCEPLGFFLDEKANLYIDSNIRLDLIQQLSRNNQQSSLASILHQTLRTKTKPPLLHHPITSSVFLSPLKVPPVPNPLRFLAHPSQPLSAETQASQLSA